MQGGREAVQAAEMPDRGARRCHFHSTHGAYAECRTFAGPCVSLRQGFSASKGTLPVQGAWCQLNTALLLIVYHSTVHLGRLGRHPVQGRYNRSIARLLHLHDLAANPKLRERCAPDMVQTQLLVLSSPCTAAGQQHKTTW